ncbi:MAG TPA: hypothetical protein PKM44_05775 [Turneriella sp.]|nr:hypothetical protein [Turneriella sp.]
MTKGLFNGIAAVFAGFVSILLLSLFAEYALLKIGVYAEGRNTTGMLLLAIAKDFIIGTIGAWFTIWLGRKHNLLHAAALAAVMIAIVLIPVSTNWGKNPLWFSLTILTLPLLYALAGAGAYRFLKK